MPYNADKHLTEPVYRIITLTLTEKGRMPLFRDLKCKLDETPEGIEKLLHVELSKILKVKFSPPKPRDETKAAVDYMETINEHVSDILETRKEK